MFSFGTSFPSAFALGALKRCFTLARTRSFCLQVSTRFSSDFLPSRVSLSSLLSVSILPSGLSSGIIVPFFFRDRQLHKAGTLKFCQVSIAVGISGERAYPQCRFDELFCLMAVLSGEMLTLMF